MKTLIAVLSVAAMSPFGLNAAGGSFTLVEGGRAAKVLMPANADESTKLAAKEFADYVEKASGARPEIVAGVAAAGKAVIIGTLATLPDVPASVRARLQSAESSEASVTVEDGGVFWIVGKEEVAELYGVYRTLEDQLGVRWFKAWEADDPGEFVPRAERIVLDGGEKFRAPYFQKRRLDMTGSSCAYIPYKGIEWAYRVGLQAWPQGGGGMGTVKLLMGPKPDKNARSLSRAMWDFYKPRTQVRLLSLGGGHMMLCDPIPAKKYFAEHPEYFAENDGKRVPGLRYCLSNPDVQRLVAEDIIAKLRMTGGRGEYLFGLMDGRSGICECAACQAMDDKGAKDRPLNSDISTRFNRAVANIAKMVYAEFPDTEALTDWVYSIYGRTPPTEVKIDPRVGGQFCIHGRCYGHRLDDPNCPLNTDRYKWLKGWMGVLSHGYTYEYGNCSHNFYDPYERAFASDIKLYAKLGLTGWKEEMSFVDSTPPSYFPKNDPEKIRRRAEKSPSNWQWFYVASRLTWDPSLDVDAVLDEIESKYYGEAYPAMKKYHALRRRLWDSSKVCLGYPRGDPRRPTLLNEPGAKEQLLKLLDEADSLATSDLTRTRLAKDRRWLTIYWIEPNEEMKKKEGKAFSSPVAKTPPAIDGRADDASWAGACWTSDYLETWSNDHKAPPAELATRAAILSDADNLYFLFRCSEPTPDKIVAKHGDWQDVYLDDAIELMMFPPSEANTYFQVCANAKGKFTVYEQPQSRKRRDLGVEVAANTRKDGFDIEVKVPVAKIYPLVKGEHWKVLFVRNRAIKDELTPKGLCWTIDAGKHQTPSDWRPMVVGDAVRR